MTSAATARPYPELPTNRSVLNQLAKRWLNQAKAEADPSALYLAQLAWWGWEKGLRTPQPLAPSQPLPSSVEEMLGLLLGSGKDKAAMAEDWVLGNPNLDRAEQAANLEAALRAAANPLNAAQEVLEAIYDRMVAGAP